VQQSEWNNWSGQGESSGAKRSKKLLESALTAESARIPQLTLRNILVTFPTVVKHSRENIDWDGGPALWRLSQRKFS
jgi:hypothetical protein